MLRRKQYKLDLSEPQVPVSFALPASIVEYLNARARKTLSPRSAYLRDAVIDRLTRDGVIADDLDVIDEPVTA